MKDGDVYLKLYRRVMSIEWALEAVPFEPDWIYWQDFEKAERN